MDKPHAKSHKCKRITMRRNHIICPLWNFVTSRVFLPAWRWPIFWVKKKIVNSDTHKGRLLVFCKCVYLAAGSFACSIWVMTKNVNILYPIPPWVLLPWMMQILTSGYSDILLIVGTNKSPLNLNAWAYVISVSQFPRDMLNDVSLFTT